MGLRHWYWCSSAGAETTVPCSRKRTLTRFLLGLELQRQLMTSLTPGPFHPSLRRTEGPSWVSELNRCRGTIQQAKTKSRSALP